MANITSVSHENKFCEVCFKPTQQKCTKCEKVFYCSIRCQKKDWKVHKLICEREVVKDFEGEKKSLLKLLDIFNTKYGYERSRAVYGHNLNLLDYPSLQKISHTPERELMWMAFFSLGRREKDSYKYLKNIPDMKIIKEEKELKYESLDDCSNFVFKDEGWFDKGDRRISSKLFGEYLSVIDFFKNKRYSEVDMPKVGSVIIYANHVYGMPPSNHSTPRVAHYGKVVEVSEEGKVIVQSKFNHAHIYQHRLDLIPYFYGNRYTFLNKN
jgi:hypothetical protein